MKKTFLMLAISTLLFSSCEKFLDTTPKDTLSPKGYFNTAAEAEVALAGVYDPLGKNSTYGRKLFFELDIADDSFVALSNWTQNVALFNYNPSDPDVTDLWVALYNAINRANVLLENLPRVQMDATRKKAIEGQALFLRGYYYFLLTNYWGDVPLRLTATSAVNDVNLKRTPYKEVYAQIVADMEKAAELVEPAGTYAYGSRVTQPVVWGVLARVNLKMAGAPLRDASRYPEVVKWAGKVIDSKFHVLNPDYRDVFIRMCNGTYDIKETIWEVEFNRYNESQAEEGSVGVINGISANAEPYGYSYGAKHTTDYYFRQFKADLLTVNGVQISHSPDMRRDWTIGTYYYDATSRAKINYGVSSVYNRFDAKWRREYEKVETRFNGSSTINFPLLRYSDVLLMYAEADNEINGPRQEAIEYVNLVRRRAYGKLSSGESIKYIEVPANGGGSGYTIAPKVEIVGGGGIGAEATAAISGGKVAFIMLTNIGSGYTSAPSVVISSQDMGSGATARVVLTSKSSLVSDLPAEQVSGQEAFRQAIRKERNLELGYEALRRFDLVRWGDYVSAMKNVANDILITAPSAYSYAARHGNNISARDTVLAIPSREMLLNKEARQNNGW